MAGHDDRPKEFVLGQASFITSQLIGKKCCLPLCNFLTAFLQLRDKNLRFTGEDLPSCSRMRVLVVIGQHDQRVKFLAGQDPILAEHFLFTGRYFELLVLLAFCDLPIANRTVSNVS